MAMTPAESSQSKAGPKAGAAMAKLHIRHGRLACQDLGWPSLPAIHIHHDCERHEAIAARAHCRGLLHPT